MLFPPRSFIVSFLLLIDLVKKNILYILISDRINKCKLYDLRVFFSSGLSSFPCETVIKLLGKSQFFEGNETMDVWFHD